MFFLFFYKNFPHKNLNLALKYIIIFIAIRYYITYNNYVPYYFLYLFIYHTEYFLTIFCLFVVRFFVRQNGAGSKRSPARGHTGG